MIKPIILFHKFKLPVFKAEIWIVIGNTLKASIDYVEDKTSEKIAKEEEKPYIKAYTYAYETTDNIRKYILLFKYTATPGEIAHEVKHLINILFNWHEVKLSTTNDEMECYYLEDVVDKVHSAINRYRKLYKKVKQK